MPRKPISPFILLLAGLLSCPEIFAQTKQSPAPVRQGKIIRVTHGAVVSSHPLASRVGLSILRAGGNAVDATRHAVGLGGRFSGGREYRRRRFYGGPPGQWQKYSP